MNLKFTLRLAAVVLVILRSGGALFGAAEGADSSWVLTPSVVSNYLFRGVRVAGPSLQPGLDYTAGRLNLGVWSSVPLQHEGPGPTAWESDLYGAFTFELLPDRLQCVPGFTLYTYPNARRSEGLYRATFEPSLAVNYVFAGVRFTPKLFYDFILEGPTAEISAAVACPLKRWGTELDFSATVGTFRLRSVVAEAEPSVKNGGDYWSASVALPVQVTAHSKVTLGVTYSEGRNNFFKQGSAPREPNDHAVRRAAVTLSYAIAL